jgi:signal peptidase I
MNKFKRYSFTVKNMSVSLLSEGKTIRIKAHGYSMYPAIKPGALILIEPVRLKGKPVPGEIVALKRDSGMVVHRVVRKIMKDGIEYFVTRGDSNSMADNPVTIDRIAGRVIKSEPTGENPVAADIRINTKPSYVMNRFRVIGIFLMQKTRKIYRRL